MSVFAGTAALKAFGIQQGLYYKKINVGLKSCFEFLFCYFISKVGISHVATSWHSTDSVLRF